MKYSKKLFWSKLIIKIKADIVDEDLINNCFLEAEKFEKKYSRFIKWNYLYNLNKNKNSQIDWEFLSIMKLCRRVSELTDWFFDITILPLLENRGYGIYKDKVNENIWYKNIEIIRDKIILNNNVFIDIGSVWKWYIVDKIYKILDSVYNNFVIDFWWDIRIKWKQTIYLEDPYDEKKVIWKIGLENLSLASSSWNKRKTKLWHHLINPKDKNSQNDKIAIFLTHKLSSFSDIFSTALFVCPLLKSIEILNKIDWLEWFIISAKWEIFKSNGFNCELNGYIIN